MPIVTHEEQFQIGSMCVVGYHKTGEEQSETEACEKCRQKLHVAARDSASGRKQMRQRSITLHVKEFLQIRSIRFESGTNMEPDEVNREV